MILNPVKSFSYHKALISRIPPDLKLGSATC